MTSDTQPVSHLAFRVEYTDVAIEKLSSEDFLEVFNNGSYVVEAITHQVVDSSISLLWGDRHKRFRSLQYKRVSLHPFVEGVGLKNHYEQVVCDSPPFNWGSEVPPPYLRGVVCKGQSFSGSVYCPCQFHIASRVTPTRCDSHVQGAVGKWTASRPNLCYAERQRFAEALWQNKLSTHHFLNQTNS